MTADARTIKPGIVSRRRANGLAFAAGALGAAGLGLALSPTTARAADDQGPTNLSDVTVTAARNDYGAVSNTLTKLPKDLEDIPQSVTVLNKALLDSEGATSLADALRNVPGITIGGAEGGQIGNNINLNGFTARTDIYLDGFRDRGQYYRDTFALDSVEVLMGPSSMLFGRGSTGGAINQVSKRPTLRPSTELTLSGTTNGLARGTADVNAPLSDRAALRVAVMGQDGAVSTRKATTVRDYGVAPSYAFGIGEPTQVTVSALVQHNNDRPDYGVPPLNGQPVESGRNTVYGYSDDRTIQDIVTVGAEVKHRFASGLTLRDQLQYNGVTTDARETAPQGIGTVGAGGYAALSPAGISSLPLGQLWARLQSHDRVIHDTSLFNQAEASGDFATGPVKHSLLIGTEFGHDEYRNQGYYRTGSCNGVALATGYVGCVPVLNPSYSASPAATTSLGNLARGKADTAAVYVNDTIALTSTFKLVTGVRYDNYAATISNSINSGNTAGNTSLARASQTVSYTSVRTGAIWQPTKAQSYYVSYSTSFDPSLEQLTSTTGLSRPLPPETNTAYEAGGKWDLLHDQLDLTAAVFQITQENSRSQNPNNTYTANGTIRVRGARIGVAGRLTSRWQVFGGYTHLDARIIDAIASNTLGKIPANTPGDTATIWTTYAVTRQWEVGGGAVYMSKRYLNNTDLVSVPSYVRWDATIAYHQPRYDIRLNLFNLFDAHYYDSLIQSDGGRAVPGSGRTAMISLVYRP
ncbi:MAG: TonB-dependent siderophore receptor [Caulobacteraceae bacterium]|nr:TonB-dependent siderophore receptor [Caulobacteraceae bacterium]